MFEKLNNKDLFIYPYYDDSGMDSQDKLFLLYSPITRKAVWIDFETANRIENEDLINDQLQKVIDELTDFIPLKYQTCKVRQVKDYPLLTVLPNQKCNLSCSYCYSAKGRSNTELDSQILKNTIDFFIDSKEHNKPLSISYMGGGEPMLSWPLVSESILYAKKTALSLNKKIDFTIITNGTIITNSIIDFIIENEVNISISFDIIKEIQNEQRGQYDQVVCSIRSLIAHGIIPQINSTITPKNVNRMLEMYLLLETQFPEIRNMMFEPVTASELFLEAKYLACFLKEYTRSFLAIDLLAREKDKSLTSFPYLRTVFPTERACAGEFCLTADGKLSGCYCITTPVDCAYDKCIYGEVLATNEGENVVINRTILESLLNENVYSKTICNECCVKWNCGGGCFHLFNSYPQTLLEAFCDFTREYVQKVVLSRYERLYKKHFGVMPNENKEGIKKNLTILNVG